MFKIDGLDKLQMQLKQAEKAFQELDGEIGKVSFDPDDPTSISGAIQSMERMIDDRVGQFANNELIAPMIEATKEEFRDAIIAKASQARLEADDE
ncbi:MAG: hypothetical protein AAF498_12460 [Pseudomonadota bacterium]